MSQGAPVSRQRYERERTARRAAEALLEEKSRLLFEAQNARARMLSAVSHELKTPIHGILGAAQMIDHPDNAESVRDVVELLRDNGEHLLHLINALIGTMEIDAGTLELSENEVALAPLLEKAAVRALSRHGGADRALETSIDPTLSNAWFTADGPRLFEVFYALIENALKFSGEGTVRARLATAPSGGIALTVDDSGPGIPAAHRDQLFQPFVRADESMTRAHGGLGFGLPLVRGIVRACGRDVALGDSPLGGLRVRATLPLTRVRCSEKIGPSAADGEGARVLIVDDNPVNRMIAHAAVSKAGMHTQMAENGCQALSALAKSAFDLVLMDIQMPVMSGEEAICQIRASGSAYAQVPILVVTANAESGQEQYYRSIGASGMVAKPIGFDGLLGEVLSLLNPAQARAN